MNSSMKPSEAAVALESCEQSGRAMEPKLLPPLFTVLEVAKLLRTSRKAIYSMIARGQLPGVVRVGRRVLVRADELLDWLDRCRTPLPKD